MSAAIVAVTSTAATNASVAAAAANRARQKHCNEVLLGFEHEKASPQTRFEYAQCISDFHRPTQPASIADVVFLSLLGGGALLVVVMIAVAAWRLR